jgi:hypothetical protein
VRPESAVVQYGLNVAVSRLARCEAFGGKYVAFAVVFSAAAPDFAEDFHKNGTWNGSLIFIAGMEC